MIAKGVINVEPVAVLQNRDLMDFETRLTHKFWFNGKEAVLMMPLGKVCTISNTNFPTWWARCSKRGEIVKTLAVMAIEGNW